MTIGAIDWKGITKAEQALLHLAQFIGKEMEPVDTSPGEQAFKGKKVSILSVHGKYPHPQQLQRWAAGESPGSPTLFAFCLGREGEADSIDALSRILDETGIAHARLRIEEKGRAVNGIAVDVQYIGKDQMRALEKHHERLRGETREGLHAFLEKDLPGMIEQKITACRLEGEEEKAERRKVAQALKRLAREIEGPGWSARISRQERFGRGKR